MLPWTALHGMTLSTVILVTIGVYHQQAKYSQALPLIQFQCFSYQFIGGAINN